MVQESIIVSLINEYLPNTQQKFKDELSLFIDRNLDLECKEIEHLLEIIAKI